MGFLPDLDNFNGVFYEVCNLAFCVFLHGYKIKSSQPEQYIKAKIYSKLSTSMFKCRQVASDLWRL